MIKISFYLLMLLESGLKTQSKDINKTNLYIFFEYDTLNKIYKRHLTFKHPKSGKIFEYDLYDFFYTSPINRHYQFVNKPAVSPKIVNSKYIKQVKTKSLEWLKKLKEPLPSTFYKDFPYNKIFLVEKSAINQYRITEIESFLGKEF